MNHELSMANVSTGARLLIADEDLTSRHLLNTVLTQEGYQVYEVQFLWTVFKAIQQQRPDVLIIDLQLLNGADIEMLAAIRTNWRLLPIIVISEQPFSPLTVQVFNAGADDYLTRPFNLDEISSRIYSALRRIASSNMPLIIGDLTIDLIRRTVTRNQQDIHLTLVEYDILKILIAHLDKVVTPMELAAELWGDHSHEKLIRLRSYMGKLRTKLEADPKNPRLIMREKVICYRLSSPGFA
jgi:two-component system, OmpR family, KDP operon response regulator KdpE